MINLDKQYIEVCLDKAGKQWAVAPLERYTDKDGTESSRWVYSEKKHFDTIDEALSYMKAFSDKLVD